MPKLIDLAQVVRSKNAGPFELTLDIMLPDKETYHRVLSSGAISTISVASMYGVDERNVLSIIAFEPANAIKITLARPVSSGSIWDTDIYGAQQHAPLMELTIPD